MKLACSLFYAIVLIIVGGNQVNGQQALSWNRISGISLTNLSSKNEVLKPAKLSILVMLSPECPLSRNYIPVLNKMQSDNKDIRFYGIFPGRFYSIDEIRDFKKEFNIDFNLLLDQRKLLVNYIKATTTPECVVIDAHGMILYRGLIDNWPVSLGNQRKIITERYLATAIHDFSNNQPITVKNTKPVGCMINDN